LRKHAVEFALLHSRDQSVDDPRQLFNGRHGDARLALVELDGLAAETHEEH
jgi:hypothetical protein